MPTTPAQLRTLLPASVTEDELLGALYVLRAPRHLNGFLPAIKQFQLWRARVPAFNELPGVAGYDAYLAVIDALVDVEPPPSMQDLTGKPFEHFKNKWAPMLPLAGDSVICELLVLESVNRDLHACADGVFAWLAWQAQRYQVLEVDQVRYRAYLDRPIDRLRQYRHGERLYKAYLAISKLFHESKWPKLVAFSRWLTEFSEDASLKLLLLLRVADLDHASRERRQLIRYGSAQWHYNASSLVAAASALSDVTPRPVYTLLLTIWGKPLKRCVGALDAAVGGKRRPGSGSPRSGHERPQIRYTEFVLEMIARVDELRLHGGSSVAFFERPERDPTYEAGDDDPDESGQAEPIFSLFMADSDDLIQGYYAAKGQQSAIEYRNAQLRWNRSILSKAARESLLEVIAQGASTGGTQDVLRAKLALGLSLVTGRDLEQVASVRIADGGAVVDDDNPIAIDATANTLHVLAGRPHLQTRVDGQQPLCHPPGGELVLPLPAAWKALVAAIDRGRYRQKAHVQREARNILRALDPRLHVTSSALRETFIQALAEQTRGDLGAQKAITDGVEANAQNVIHYASYAANEIERTWRLAAEKLVGPLDTPPSRSMEQWVGAQHPFDMDALAGYFADIRSRLQDAGAARDVTRTFNLSTLYLAYWLELGLALRKTLDPVPIVRVTGLRPAGSCWALITDKSRPDGSTDRMIPISDSLVRQIERHVALTQMLSLSIPELRARHGSFPEEIELRLQYLQRDGTAVAYRPRYQEHEEQLEPLPANWGRKVMRSYSRELPGRFRDAGLGHWVRGRRPWDMTSTFDATAFHRAWSGLQQHLEGRLGFVPIPLMSADVPPLAPLPCRSPTVRRARNTISRTAAAREEIAIEEEIESAVPGQLARLDAQVDAVDREGLLDLARRAVAKQPGPAAERRAFAEDVCAWLRKRYRVPLYATSPRPLFGSSQILDASGLQALMYLQRNVLAAVKRDWYRLPANSLVTRDQAIVERGRLVMMAIWRLGLTSWNLVDAWLQALHDGLPILAQGPNRYQILRVVVGTTREAMRRVVFLDPFTSSYLVIERDRIRTPVLAPLYGDRSALGARKRRSRVETALRRYLVSMGAPSVTHPLTVITGAAVQRLMLGSAPIIAAYSSGRVVTEDLDDASLRRLGGLTLRRRGAGAVVQDELPSSRTGSLSGEDEPPQDVLESSGLIRALRKSEGLGKVGIAKALTAYQADTPAETLLQRFARWLLRERQDAVEEEFSGRGRGYFLARVKIVAFSLLGYASERGQVDTLDQELLEELQEITREHFPERMVHGAWFQFHAFLRDADVDHAGVNIGALGTPPERAVSARILDGADIQALLGAVLSVRSGIGNAALRQAARRHVELMMAYGMRRAESTGLRHLDQQGDACRVQAYPGHRLKTAWADRLLPIDFAPEPTRTWLSSCSSDTSAQVIDPAPKPTEPVGPDNFYDAVNRLIKQVTGDPDMGSHHLRHTFASRVVLTLLNAPAGLSALDAEFPWLAGLIIEPERMRVLLGSEGDAGQGLRALSALVGHSHPTTTLRHYVHVLCIALYGALRKLDDLDMTPGFEARVASRATMQRWVKEARAEGAAQDAGSGRRCRIVHRALRDRIEAARGDAGIDRDETPRERSFPVTQPEMGPARPGAAGSTEATWPHSGRIDFDEIERMDRSLRDGGDLVPRAAQEEMRLRLAELARILSGKRGTTVLRHPLEEMREGVFLPRRVAAGTATEAAVALCQWLDVLRAARPEDFDWLLCKWKYASERARGWMRLDGRVEVRRAQAIDSSDRVSLEIRHKILSGNRQSGRPGTQQMRIKCVGAAGKIILRDTIAVRWVMSYVAAGSLFLPIDHVELRRGE